MIGIKFSKERAQHYIDCIVQGKPIEGIQTQHDFLALAGACHAAAFTHGPLGYQIEKYEAMHKETREAVQAGFYDDLSAAIEFYSHLTLLVLDDEYDGHGFKPECEAAITKRDGNLKLIPGDGMPKPDNEDE
jgi:hypothetical protein